MMKDRSFFRNTNFSQSVPLLLIHYISVRENYSTSINPLCTVNDRRNLIFHYPEILSALIEEMGEDDNGALVVLESAKKLMNKGYYSEAADSIKIAMELCPSIENGFGMLIISETLLYANICYKYEEEEGFDEFDYYAVLHLHSSSTKAEIKTRFEDLVNELTHINSTDFSEHLHALLLINHSKSELCHESLRPKFNKRRMDNILFERPISRQKASFREDYLNWKPPTYCYGVAKLHRLLPGFMDMGLLSYPRFVRERNSSSPCEEFRYLTKHVFDKMPQRPHYEMLSVLFQGKILEGMKLVLDVAYVNLVEEIQKVTSLPTFLHKSKGFRKDLKQLSRMGYNVDKLQERINTLETISKRDQTTRVLMKQTKDEVGTLNLRFWELNDETRKCKNEVKNLGSRLSELINAETRKCKDEVSNLDSRLLELDDETQECKDSIEEHNLELQDLEIELGNVLSEFELATQSSMWD